MIGPNGCKDRFDLKCAHGIHGHQSLGVGSQPVKLELACAGSGQEMNRPIAKIAVDCLRSSLCHFTLSSLGLHPIKAESAIVA